MQKLESFLKIYLFILTVLDLRCSAACGILVPHVITFLLYIFMHKLWAFQVALVVKNPPANAGDARDSGLIPEWRRSPEGRHGNPLQCSCLENPRDRGDCWATVHWIAKGQTQPKQCSTHARTCTNYTNLYSHCRKLKYETEQTPSPLQIHSSWPLLRRNHCFQFVIYSSRYQHIFWGFILILLCLFD